MMTATTDLRCSRHLTSISAPDTELQVSGPVDRRFALVSVDFIDFASFSLE